MHGVPVSSWRGLLPRLSSLRITLCALTTHNRTSCCLPERVNLVAWRGALLLHLGREVSLAIVVKLPTFYHMLTIGLLWPAKFGLTQPAALLLLQLMCSAISKADTARLSLIARLSMRGLPNIRLILSIHSKLLMEVDLLALQARRASQDRIDINVLGLLLQLLVEARTVLVGGALGHLESAQKALTSTNLIL